MKAYILLAVLAATPAGAAVSALHPRVYVRHDEARTGAGLTVRQLRARLGNPVYSVWRQTVSSNGAAAAVERAGRYLETGSAEELAAVRELLTTRTFSYEKNDVGGFLAGAEMAIAFDWVYDGLAQEERRAAMANIVTTAESSRNFLLNGQPDINHNYTYMALNAVAVCGLVLSGEEAPYHAKAEQYLALARRFLEGPGMVLDTWNAREGAWAEGSHYTFHETLRTLILTLQAYRSASNTDYFPLIHDQHGDFVSKAGRFLIACVRPDMTFERTGDISASRAPAALTVPLTVEMLADGAGDASERARLRSFSRALLDTYATKAVAAEFGWGMRIFHDPLAAVEPSYRTLPLFQRFGAGTYEQFMLRSGWVPDSAMVTIVAGDQFTDHQHFDKGQFLIYHRGGLAVDSGTYSGMYQPGKHANEYAPRTLAHNCLLIHDPEQTMPAGYSNDGGQTIVRGKQHHADWPSYLAHRRSEGLDTAEVEASDLASNRYAYVRVNLTNAYGGRANHYDRQFVYVPGSDLLLVFDRVTSTKAGFEKRWLLHFEDRPSVDGQTAPPGVKQFPGAALTTVRRRGTFQPGGTAIPYDGELTVQTLLPEKRVTSTVGGEGFEFYSTFTGMNYPAAAQRPGSELREAGAWRLEVAPAEAAQDELFLNVMHFSAPGGGGSAKALLIKPEKGRARGAHVRLPARDEVVLFAAVPGGRPIALPLEYRVESPARASHLITQLRPGEQVVVRVNGGAGRRAAANEQGVLEFDDLASGSRRISITGAR